MFKSKILIPTDNESESIDFVAKDSGNKNWMPGNTTTEKYTVTLSGKPEGEYWLAIQLFDIKTETPVEIGLTEDIFGTKKIRPCRAG